MKLQGSHQRAARSCIPLLNTPVWSLLCDQRSTIQRFTVLYAREGILGTMPMPLAISNFLQQCRGASSVRVTDPTVVIIKTAPASTGTNSSYPACSAFSLTPGPDSQPTLNTKHNMCLPDNSKPLKISSSLALTKIVGSDDDSGATLIQCNISDCSEASSGQIELRASSDVTQAGANNPGAKTIPDSSRHSSAEVPRELRAPDRNILQSDSYRYPSRTSNTKPDSLADVFDSSRVEAAVEEPLTKIAEEMLEGVVQQLGLHEEKLRRFLREVERSMLPNKYHNALHVLDVTQLMYLQTTKGGPIADICADPVVKLSALLAAICHDYNHPGFSTGFLVSTGHQLVERYGKDSTLEKMHLHCLRELCADPNTGFMDGLDAVVQERVLNYAEHIIMATDMSQHMAYINAEPPEDPEELIIFKLKLAMKCADLSHCVRKFSIHYAFVEKLKAEFYHQGDKERELQLPISPGMERGEDYRQMAFSQAYFLSNFILPLYTAWSKHTNGNAMVEKLRAVLQRNITSWKVLCAEADTTGYDAKTAYSGSIPVRKLVRDAETQESVSKSWNNLVMQEQVQAMYGLV